MRSYHKYALEVDIFPMRFFIVICLLGAGALVFSSSAAAQESTPSSSALPSVLQDKVDANPPDDKPKLYPIVDTGVGAIALAEADVNGVIWIDQRGVSSYWGALEGEYRAIFGLAGSRSFVGLAKGGNGQILYGWESNTILQMNVGEMGWEELPVFGPADLDELIVTTDGNTLFAQAGDRLWRVTQPFLDQWEELEDLWLAEPLNGPPSVVNTDGILFMVDEIDILDARGSGIGVAHEIATWNLVTDEWDNASWNLTTTLVDTLNLSADGKELWVLTSTPEFWLSGQKWPANQIIERGITAILRDPNRNEVLYAGTKDGLFVHLSLDEGWTAARGEGQSLHVYDIMYHPRWEVPIIATEKGVFFLVFPETQPLATASPPVDSTLDASETPAATQTLTPTPTATPTPTPYPLVQFYQTNQEKAWFWPVTVISGFITTYFLGVGALLLRAWRAGSKVFAGSWLREAASKPLLVTPGLGQWALFLGYRSRLEKQPDIQDAKEKVYFGLPARAPSGEGILPAPDGKRLHEQIAAALDYQHPVILAGKGGAGKTTLLARMAYLALNGKSPDTLKGYRPIFITPGRYDGDLLETIANTLRERDGIAVDKNMMQAQMETGKFLVLFDGVSEIRGDKAEGLREILRTARNADYRFTRFVISTRPELMSPAEIAVFRLNPLTPGVILDLLPRYNLDREQEHQVERQLELFGEKPLEPLLLRMILTQSSERGVSRTRAQLYERYFCRLLQINENDEDSWRGWRSVLEQFSSWFSLETGRRGLGLAHEPLVDLMIKKNLIKRVKQYSRLSVKDELELLAKLKSAGILQAGRRWRFTHDTFEEFFVASHLLSTHARDEKIPSLDAWTISDEQVQAFLGVIEFVNEMLREEPEQTRVSLVALNLPEAWKI